MKLSSSTHIVEFSVLIQDKSIESKEYKEKKNILALYTYHHRLAKYLTVKSRKHKNSKNKYFIQHCSGLEAKYSFNSDNFVNCISTDGVVS